MSVYQFDLFDGTTRLAGSNRIDLPSDRAAVQYATQIARGLKWVRWPVHITAENGMTVGCVDPAGARSYGDQMRTEANWIGSLPTARRR